MVATDKCCAPSLPPQLVIFKTITERKTLRGIRNFISAVCYQSRTNKSKCITRRDTKSIFKKMTL